MKHFIVTKYDSAKRDENRVYLDATDEWSEACDIGKEFKGKLFTTQDYLATEKGYVDTVLAFFDASGLAHLRMTAHPHDQLNQPDHMQEFKEKYPALYEPAFEDVEFEDDRKVGRDELELLIKMNLRDAGVCDLAVANRFYLKFGWDFYVYIECEFAPDLPVTVPAIYAEEMAEQGPYMPRGEIEILVDKIELGQDLVTEGDLTFLGHITRLEMSALLGYSNEFPFITHMKITPQIAKKIAHLTNYKFEFDKFEYAMHTNGIDYYVSVNVCRSLRLLRGLYRSVHTFVEDKRFVFSPFAQHPLTIAPIPRPLNAQHRIKYAKGQVVRKVPTTDMRLPLKEIGF